MSKIEDVLNDFNKRLTHVELQIQKFKDSSPSVELPQPPLQKFEGLSGEATYQGSTFEQERESAADLASNQAPNAPLNSSTILGLIGIIFVILAGVFFIKITIDSGWLTPIRQILIAAGTGLAFFIAPQLFPKAEKEYGALLAGAGTTILHLTWLGAYFFHRILDANSALVCATLIGIFSVLANFDKGNRIYLLVTMAGTYLAAPTIGYDIHKLSTLAIFLIIWNLSFSATALVNKRRDILFIASYFAVFTTLLLSDLATELTSHKELLRLQILQFLIFASAQLSYSIFHKSPMRQDEGVAVFPLLLLFYFAAGHLITFINPEFAPWFGIIIGVIVLGFYFLARKFINEDLKSSSSLTAFAALSFVHSFYFRLLSEAWQPLVGLVIAISLIMIWRDSEKARTNFYWPMIILFSTFFYGAILTVIPTKSIELLFFYNWAYGATALIWAIGMVSMQGHPSKSGAKFSPWLLAFGHFEVMLGLYRFSEQVPWSGALFVTISWGIYAALILSVAYWRHDKTLGKSALTILLAVSLKAFLYDVGNTSSMIRVFCLLAEGLLLYACGWIFKKMQTWNQEGGRL